MELVGAVSSIITVIQITGIVISTCYDFQRGTRHYRKDIIAITNELQSLRNVLETIADITSSQDLCDSVALLRLDSLQHSGGPLEICKDELKRLETKLVPAQSRSRELGRALVWPLREKEAQRTLGALARQRGILQLALTADQATTTLALRYLASKNEASLAALTERSKTTDVNQRNDQILGWLAAPDPSSNHSKACCTKHPETGRWLLESLEYTTWKNHPASFLWINGIPGCGKTVLCSTIIEDILCSCRIDRRNTLAYYYFDFNEPKKRSRDGLARSLVRQLLDRSLENLKMVEEVLVQCGEDQTEPTSGALTALLRNLIAQRKETYIILDALDESVEIPAVISMIDDMRSWRNLNLHILVTSRKETSIEKGFGQLITHQVCIQTDDVDADIKLLVRECLCCDPDLSRWSETIKAEIEKTLCEGSQGM